MVSSRSLGTMLFALALVPGGRSAWAQDREALQRLLVAEDARGQGRDGTGPMMEGLRSRDTLLRRVAVRAIGRLQRPDLGLSLRPLLSDTIPAIRAEAALAMAQSVRRQTRGTRSDSTSLTSSQALQFLSSSIKTETDDSVAGVIAEAIGRLPLANSIEGPAAEAAIIRRAGGRLNYGMAHGLFWLALAGQSSGGLSASSVGLLREAALMGPETALRRIAVLTLARAGGLDSGTTLAASRDPDAQVRRLALAGAARLDPPARLGPRGRAELVRRAFADSSPIVRVAAVAASRVGPATPDCAPLIAALEDPHPYVLLAVIDALGLPCSNVAEAGAILARIVAFRLEEDEAGRAWQANAHALVSLSRVDSAAASRFLDHFAGSTLWQNRVYAATAAGHLRNTAVLYRLTRDRDDNVGEAAISALARIQGHQADSVYLAALGREGNQVLLAAGEALKGSTHPAALDRLLGAFDRISRRRSETARDPRLALLARIGELGTSATATRLRPYLADFDTSVARTTATILTRWSGAPVEARPVRLPIEAEPLADVFLAKRLELRVTMARGSGGGSFVLRLRPREAPATVARIIRRVREHYYDGTLFQRVVPNFVIQGGGHGASEYIGDDRYMRDEVGLPHFRGTVGISTRGRDTGDAQMFINLVDNSQLDHEYTVFAQVVAGMEVVDRILESDEIERVEVVGDPE